MAEVMPSYVPSARDRRIEKGSKKKRGALAPFEISRPISEPSSIRTEDYLSGERDDDGNIPPRTFADAFYRIPRFSKYQIKAKRGRHLPELPSMRLLTYSSVKEVVNDPDFEGEQKDVDLLSQSILDSVNGAGSKVVELSASEFIPRVVNRSSKYLGCLVVADAAEHYELLATASQRASNRLVSSIEEQRDLMGERPLEPWIEIVANKNERVVSVALKELHESMIDNEISIVLGAARSLRDRR